METTPTLGAWIKWRRRRLGLTQKELARLVGYAEVTLRKMEAGVLRPSPSMAVQIAQALQLTPQQEEQFLRFARGEAHWNDLALPAQATPFPIPSQQSPSGGPSRHPHNLPLAVSSFVGRGDEMAAVTQLLARHRLVTLTGLGGCGKTRLAVETAGNLLPGFAGGVWLVDLAPLADPALVAQAAATALGVRERPSRTWPDVLAEHLRRQPTLLLLDNCEHLVAACAQLATALL